MKKMNVDATGTWEQENQLREQLKKDNVVVKFFRGMYWWFLNKKRVTAKRLRDLWRTWFPGKTHTYYMDGIEVPEHIFRLPYRATKAYADERQKAKRNRKQKPSKAMKNLYHL